MLASLVALAASPAMATIVLDPWSVSNPSDELNLFEIVNALYGTSYTSSAQMLFAQIDPHDEVFSGSHSILAEAKYAGYNQTIGWYQETGAGDPDEFHVLFTATGNGLGNFGSATINPTGNFGLFETAGPAGSPPLYTWYSESDENANGEDHMVTYDVEQLTNNSLYHNVWLAGWEDKPFNVSDKDYDDFVLQYTIVPEPSTLLLMGMGLAAMAGYLRRNKNIA